MSFSKTGSLIRGCIVLVAIAAASRAQDAHQPEDTGSATIASGVPLRVILDRRVRTKRVGQPLQGRLFEPVYVYDRIVIPAQTVIEGHVAGIGGVPAARRLKAILSGNLTPPREVRAQFDTLVLNDGLRLPLQTSLSRGATHFVLVTKPRNKQPGLGAVAQGAQAVRALKAPGKIARLKDALLERLPYHRQAWPAGTLFNGVLQDPLTLSAPRRAGSETSLIPGALEGKVSARLLTPINSANSPRGTPVEAVVTRPQFSPDHRLLIPEGSRLLGAVVEAKPARRFHRNGKLLFVFREVRFPSGTAQYAQGYLEELQAAFTSHLAIDPEGAARASSPKSRFIFPVIALAAAGLSLHQDYNSQGVPDQDIGGRAESGAVGLGLIGTILAQASHVLASSIAFTGAGFSIYSNFIARGENVVLPLNTPIEVSLSMRPGETAGRQR